MLKELKRLAGHSVIYGAGSIISRTLNFFLLPLYTNVFTREEYGVASLVFTFLAFMNIIYHYGMDTAFLRYYAMEDSKEEKSSILGTTFLSVLLTSSMLSCVIFFNSRELAGLLLGGEQHFRLIRFAAWIIFFDTLYVFPYLIMRIEERAVRFTSINLLNVIINVSGNILFIIVLKSGIEGIFISNLLASGFTFLVCLHLLPGRIRFAFSLSRWKALLAFGLPYVPAGLASMIMEVIDRYMLAAMRTVEEVGLYSSGYKLGVFMLVVVMGFKFAWQPYFLKKGRDLESAKKAFKLVMTYFLSVTLFLFLLVSFYIDELLHLKIGSYTFFGRQFWDSTIVVPPVLLAYIFLGISAILMPGIYIEKRSFWIPVINGTGALTNILLNLLLIPRMGISGAAIATTVSYLILALTQFFIVQRFFYIQYEYFRIAKLFLVTAIIFIIHVTVGDNNIVDLFLLFSYPVILFLLRFFKKEELNIMKSIIFRAEKGTE